MSLKENLETIREHFPKILQEWFPVRWNMPSEYANPEYIVAALLTQMLAAEKLATEPDNCISCWLHIDRIRKYVGPPRVYCLEKELGFDLLRTDPKDLDMTTLKAPLRGFSNAMSEREEAQGE